MKTKNFTPKNIEIGATYEHSDWKGIFLYIGGFNGLDKKLIIIKTTPQLSDRLGAVVKEPGETEASCDQNWWNKFSIVSLPDLE